jgi:hypothetical protein
MRQAPYTAFVHRVWDGIQRRTGHQPWYIDGNQIISYCPSCLTGTMRLSFTDHPQPRFVVLSRSNRDPGLSDEFYVELERMLSAVWGEHIDKGSCSNGCSARDIGLAIA